MSHGGNKLPSHMNALKGNVSASEIKAYLLLIFAIIEEVARLDVSVNYVERVNSA
jgi:hypothetical protein